MQKIKLILGAALALFLAYQAYGSFYHGTPYQGRDYSPDQAFYYQKYRLFSWRTWIPSMTMPGDGDSSRYSVGGYLRVFKADGTLVGQSYDDCIAVVEVSWYDNAVGGFGCGEHLIALSAKATPD
ncbi:hypothetical protein GGD92_07275 [Pseudomonas protegens]|uniref:Uncharacterized protein n=1 Tax=Pseudomonas protegens TaxID=380021 RepID=A0A7G8YQV9_9PSED|nr:hypothetical protein [Pseudomonas protegens]QNH78057.1 hypothetical protein GGI48_02350 [Pseudomonas protegens]QNL07253.1 hypothetical protein GGD92_07275 [Pseudomonas protegens]